MKADGEAKFFVESISHLVPLILPILALYLLGHFLFHATNLERGFLSHPDL